MKILRINLKSKLFIVPAAISFISILLAGCSSEISPHNYGFDGGVYFGENYKKDYSKDSIVDLEASDYCTSVADKGAEMFDWANSEISEARLSCLDGIESQGIEIIVAPSPYDYGKDAGIYGAEQWVIDFGSESPPSDFVAEYCGGLAFESTSTYSWSNSEMDAFALACIDEFVTNTGSN